MTPEPVKALAELRALSDAATPGPWSVGTEAPIDNGIWAEQPTKERDEDGVQSSLVAWCHSDWRDAADAAFIVALVNAFRADPAALLSLVPRDGVSEATLGEALHHWRHPDHAGKPGWGICDCMAVARSIAADYRLILNRDTGSAEPEPGLRKALERLVACTDGWDEVLDPASEWMAAIEQARAALNALAEPDRLDRMIEKMWRWKDAGFYSDAEWPAVAATMLVHDAGSLTPEDRERAIAAGLRTAERLALLGGSAEPGEGPLPQCPHCGEPQTIAHWRGNPKGWYCDPVNVAAYRRIKEEGRHDPAD